MSDGLSNVASSLAATLLKKQLEQGGIIEIPSLNTYIAGRGRMKAVEVEAKLDEWDIQVDIIRAPIVALVERVVKTEAELERLQRIEAAARTFLDEVTHFGSGATAARKALVEALES